MRRPTGDQEVAGSTPHRDRQHSFVEIDHEIYSTVILSLPLIQEEKCIYKGSLLFGGEVLNIFIECNKKYHYFHECEARVKK